MKAQILIFDNINLHTPENGEQPNTPPVATRKTPDATNGVLDAAASLLTAVLRGNMQVLCYAANQLTLLAATRNSRILTRMMRC